MKLDFVGSSKMGDEKRLQDLKHRMAQTHGHLTRWRRICAERQAVTVEDKIVCAEQALSTPHSGSWAEGFGDAFRLREIELAGSFDGEIPED